MESNRLIKLSLGIMIAVIITATALMPVISDATETHQTFTNNDYWCRMTKYDTTAELTISWDYTNPSVLTVNSVDITLPKKDPTTVIGTSNLMVRSNYNRISGSVYGLQEIDEDHTTLLPSNVAGSNTMTATVSGGTIKYTVGGTTRTVTYDDYLFVISNDGDYVMKKSDWDAYLAPNSEVYAIGRTLDVGSSGTHREFVISGTPSSGFDRENYPPMSEGTTFSDVESDLTAMPNHKGYTLSEFTFDVFVNDVETGSVVYNYFIVPYQVSLEKTVHLNSGQIAMINAIPIVVIAAILAAAVGMMLLKRE